MLGRTQDRIRPLLKIMLFLSGLMAIPTTSANSLQVDYLGQSPTNVVPVGQSITYTLKLENVLGPSLESDSISVGIGIKVNGSLIPADSGEFVPTMCVVDPLDPDYWNCSSLLGLGFEETVHFTWISPKFGTSTLEFLATCQEWPIPAAETRLCAVNGMPSGSAVAKSTTHYVEITLIFSDGFEES